MGWKAPLRASPQVAPSQCWLAPSLVGGGGAGWEALLCSHVDVCCLRGWQHCVQRTQYERRVCQLACLHASWGILQLFSEKAAERWIYVPIFRRLLPWNTWTFGFKGPAWFMLCAKTRTGFLSDGQSGCWSSSECTLSCGLSLDFPSPCERSSSSETRRQFQTRFFHR